MKREWNNFFKPEDQDVTHRSGRVIGISVEKANAILREELEKAPVVYGYTGVNGAIPIKKSTWQGWASFGKDADTHTARLVAIEELKK